MSFVENFKIGKSYIVYGSYATTSESSKLQAGDIILFVQKRPEPNNYTVRLDPRRGRGRGHFAGKYTTRDYWRISTNLYAFMELDEYYALDYYKVKHQFYAVGIEFKVGDIVQETPLYNVYRLPPNLRGEGKTMEGLTEKDYIYIESNLYLEDVESPPRQNKPDKEILIEELDKLRAALDEPIEDINVLSGILWTFALNLVGSLQQVDPSFLFPVISDKPPELEEYENSDEISEFDDDLPF